MHATLDINKHSIYLGHPTGHSEYVECAIILTLARGLLAVLCGVPAAGYGDTATRLIIQAAVRIL
jgi:hypothetical protein